LAATDCHPFFRRSKPVDRNFWAALHDGTIDSAEGCVPGVVGLTVDIDYICGTLGAAGENLGLVLHGCTAFSYTPYGDPAVNDLSKIAALEVELLYASDKGDFIEVDCREGTLKLAYESIDIRLSGGRELIPSNIVAAAQLYWKRFGERNTQR
jgi:hypothetical protein